MLKDFIIKKLGGFTNIDDAISHIKKINDEEKKREILSEAVKRLYNGISADDILKKNPDNTWTFMGRPMTASEVNQLTEEANALKNMKLWRAIRMDIKFQLGKKMFEEAKCLDDILWGQLLTFLNDVIQSRISKM